MKSDEEKESEEIDEWIEKTMVALEHIKADSKNVPKGSPRKLQGFVSCPVCEQKLSYGIASSNGHIHAVCETKNCLNFMQ